jgi:serine phosphatase RsbU (regulator of sigma subunit)
MFPDLLPDLVPGLSAALSSPLPLPSGVAAAPLSPLPSSSWFERDLAAAREIQRTFMPAIESRWRDVEISAECRPFHHVGGDFFEVRARTRGRLLAVIGDVAGKGITAALIMSRLVEQLRSCTAQGLRPGAILTRLNRWFDRQGLADRFATAACVELDLTRGRWIAAAAGHPPGLLFRSDGRSELVGEAGGPALGLGDVARWQCQEEERQARAGDTLLLMTDGLTDIIDRETVSTVVANASNGGLAGRPFLAEVQRQLFAGLTPVVSGRDDATVVGLQLSPSVLAGNC